ncbi:hypothetical protein CGK63_08095 [Vibrio parahaemolyticus]|nr:hypothetical protein D5E73_00035 [Vibrio parahaemolyticus]TBT78207.1 hypothetical protein D5E72_00040 [Vibrio parahaemolyticus]TNY75512.1 hypothetical protein CGK63_08095 [Vibrio parahaemolyticus]TOK96312.1 hypothetical protein CGI06_19885 [Vibrio parahaemolyticus]
MMLPSVIEKCKRLCACFSVFGLAPLVKGMRQIKGIKKLIRFSNPLRFRHTFASQKMHESCGPEKLLWTLSNITSPGGYDG